MFPVCHRQSAFRNSELFGDLSSRAQALATIPVDEVKDIMDKSIAIQAYARQAKNKTLEADAFEIRFRAERRLGEVLEEVPKNKGAIGSKVTGSKREPVKDKTPTIADLGIDKKLSSHSRKTAKIPEAEFELLVAKTSYRA